MYKFLSTILPVYFHPKAQRMLHVVLQRQMEICINTGLEEIDAKHRAMAAKEKLQFLMTQAEKVVA